MHARLLTAALTLTLGLALSGTSMAADGDPGAPRAEAEALTGDEIMRRVDARPRPRDYAARVVWRLIDVGGRERLRTTRVFRREGAEDGARYRSKWLVLVDGPTAVEGIGLLVWSTATATEPDEQWLYLPAYRKIRRIAGRERDDPFLGSDFSFEDLTDRGVEEDTHTLLRIESLEGVAHAVVDSLPVAADSPYGRRRHWVDLESWTPRRVQLFDAAGEKRKTMTATWQRVAGIWTWKRVEMRNARSEHRTVLEFDRVVHDSGLADGIFTKTTLRRGLR